MRKKSEQERINELEKIVKHQGETLHRLANEVQILMLGNGFMLNNNNDIKEPAKKISQNGNGKRRST